MKTLIKKSAQSALLWAMFVLGAAGMSIAYAALNYLAPVNTATAGSGVSASEWNKMVANFTTVDTKLAAVVPSGAVMAFNLASCPTGWSEYAPAYGRTIRGIDKSGTSIDPDGARTAGSTQSDMVGSHRHAQATNNGVADANPRETGNPYYGQGIDYGDGYGPVWTDYAGWAETRMKNVALLYCVKN